jgi:phosphatidate cytidylyltransferase
MNLTKDRGVMEKDNFGKKIIDEAGHFSSFAGEIFANLAKKINSIDNSTNLKQRIISSIILVIIALYAILSSGTLFLFLTILATILMSIEWVDLVKKADDQKKWRLIGVCYILIPIYSLLKIKVMSPQVLLWLFMIIWTTDIAAFFAGKMFGGARLAPKISPNKTWVGLFAGVAASMVIGLISSFMFVSSNVIFFILISGLLAVIEQLSDLIESKIKRIFDLKDSGGIIPGHGGILDRLDGITLVAPFVLMLIAAYPAKFIS